MSRRRHRKLCAREGCGNEIPQVNDKHRYCTYLCVSVARELEQAQRVCEAIGAGTSDLWSAAVALSDALSGYLAVERQVYQAATDVGVTPQQWAALQGGKRPDVSPSPRSRDSTGPVG